MWYGTHCSNDFETLIHQCRKRKWKDGVVMIVDAMRQLSESGWELSDSESSEDGTTTSTTTTTTYVIPAQPHLRPMSKTYVSIVDAYLVCGEEQMAWDSFQEVAAYPELSRDPALYRKFIRGTYLLTNCDHISEMLTLARQDNVTLSHRACVELARMHGFLHQDGLDIVVNKLPGSGLTHEKKQALLEELVLSCGYKHNTKGVEATLQGMLQIGYRRSALTETAVVICCLQHQELVHAIAMLRKFQSLQLVMKVPMYDSLLREMYFKYTRRGGDFDESSRKVALRTLYSRRALFNKVFAEMDALEKWNMPQSPSSEDVFLSTLSSAEHHQLALQYWCERSTLKCSALMFSQHVVELITTIRDKDSKASAQTAIYKALLNTQDPFLFNLRAVVSLRFLDLTFRALGKLAKQMLMIFSDNGAQLIVQPHHSAYCIAQLPDLTVHVVKEIDDVVALHASHRKEILAFCHDALENDNMDKTIGYLVHKEELYTLETAAYLVPKLAELYVLNGFITVLQYFKPEVDDSDAMRRLFLREVIEIETIVDEDAARDESSVAGDGEPQRYQWSIKAITELKLQHEDEFMPFLMHRPTRAIRTDKELQATEDPTKEYLKIPIDDDHVVIVDNDDAVALAYEVLMHESVSMLGLDAEWRPDAGKGYVQSKCSILQAACETHVFIFDLLELALSDLEDLFAHLFASKAVVKLGFGLDGDIKRLRWSFPETRCFDSFINVVDFSLDDNTSSATSNSNEDKGSASVEVESFEVATMKHRRRRQRGLAGFVHEVLGLPLSKAQQKSDWECRPLSEKQVSYAALDAYCLVMVHQTLQKQKA